MEYILEQTCVLYIIGIDVRKLLSIAQKAEKEGITISALELGFLGGSIRLD